MFRVPALLACLLYALLLAHVLNGPVLMQPDSPRYVAAGLNLAEYGILSRAGYQPETPPPPGLIEGGPLTAAELALAAKLHEPTRQQMICLARAAPPGSACSGRLLAVQLIYAVEITVFLFALYRMALLVFLESGKAWLAVGAAIACNELWRYTGFVLSEPLFLMTLGLFLWRWLAAWQRPERLSGWLLAGLCLGLAMLAKPSWSGLLPALLLMMAWSAWRRPAARRAFGLGIAALIAGYAAIALPFLIRNVIQLGQWTLSDQRYLVASLSHRLAFNLMSWREWLAGWIYYQPVMGGRIVEYLFGPEVVERLGWGDASYYVHGRDVLHRQVVGLAPPDGVRQLLADFVFSQPLKNAAVTALLLVRGLFVGGFWSVIAILLLLPALLRLMPASQRRLWWLLLLPALAVALINAQASVSLVRYNLALIPAGALVLAVVAHALLGGLLATAKTFLPNQR